MTDRPDPDLDPDPFSDSLSDVERAQQLLAGHRDSIDRLDAILAYVLGERFKHTRAVGVLKAQHRLPATDPVREARQIKRLENLSRDAGLDPDIAKNLLQFIIAEVIRQHDALREQHQGRAAAARETPKE